jgi:hypothetical protein
VPTIEKVERVTKMPSSKVKRLEQQNTHQNIKCTFVNNQFFSVNLGFTFRGKGKPEWMEKILMKKLDEKSCMTNQLGFILVLHIKIQVGY